MNPEHIQSIEKRFPPVSRSRTFNHILDNLDLKNKKVLDLGCGYGEYLVKFGEGSVGVTTTEDEIAYGKLRNIHIIKGNAEQIDGLGMNNSFDAIWANNIFEHLLSPHAFLMKMHAVSRGNALIVLGVPVIPCISQLMKISKWRGALAGAHINFFTKKSLALTVERAGWKVKSVRPFVFANSLLDYLFSFFAPHLYVVAYNISDFKYPEKKLKEWKDDEHYDFLLEITGQNQ